MRTLQDALQTASAIRSLKGMKLDASQQDQIALDDEIKRLRAINAAMLSAISRATHALEHVYSAKPLHDLDETICECKSAIGKSTS